jgi:hypothetical protein
MPGGDQMLTELLAFLTVPEGRIRIENVTLP